MEGFTIFVSLKTLITIIILYMIGLISFTVYSYNQAFDNMSTKIRWLPAILAGILWPVLLLLAMLLMLYMTIRPEKKSK